MAKIDDILGEYGDIVSVELATAIKDGIDLLALITPIGEVAAIATHIPGVPTPDPNIWQECNGGAITNPDSPLFGLAGTTRNVPNMIDRYIKVPLVFGQSGQQGGVNGTSNWFHDHGGRTGDFTSPEGVDQGKSGNLREAAFVHEHTISSDLSNIPVQPPFYVIKFFMRIQ